MACLSIKLNPVSQARLAVTVTAGAILSVTAIAQPSVDVTPKEQAQVSVTAQQNAVVTVSPQEQAQLKLSHISPSGSQDPTGGSAELTVTPQPQPSVTTTAKNQASLRVRAVNDIGVSVSPKRQAVLSIRLSDSLEMTVGEVCSICGGRIVVLAASDGPLRTKDGGYFLLNPATNPGIYFEPEQAVVTVKFTDTPYALPRLVNPYGLIVDYFSSNTNVATIDQTTGEISILAIGKTTITALASDDGRLVDRREYELNVEPLDDLIYFVPGGYYQTIMFGDDTDNLPRLENPRGLEVRYDCSNYQVVGINSYTGEIRILSPGQSRIWATAYKNGQQVDYTEYQLTVQTPTPPPEPEPDQPIEPEPIEPEPDIPMPDEPVMANP